MIQEQASHKLVPRNHSNALPRYIIAFDTETLPNVSMPQSRVKTHRFRLGTAVSGRLEGKSITCRKDFRFVDLDMFWAFVYSFTGSRHTVWLVAHNLLFDLVVSGFPERFANGQMSLDWPRSKRKREDNDDMNVFASGLAVLDSPPTIIATRVAATKGRLVMVDTLNYFRVPLSDMGKACGLEKFKMPEFDADNETWFRYCERDTEITFESFVNLLRWVKDNDMGMFRYTGPSQAYAAYRHKYMKHKIYTHDNQDVRKIERSAYFGGRTEVFRMGKIDEDVYQLDINSLFPSVMSRHEYPNVLDKFELRQGYDTDLPDVDYSKCCMEVLCEVNNPIYPVRREKGILYPIGRFHTVLCGHELAHLHRHGKIIGVRSWASYRTADLFTLWVDSLWRMRADYRASQKDLYATFVKTLLNSLYGKFAQLAPQWANRPDGLANLPWSSWFECNIKTGERKEFRSVGWTIQEKIERTEIDSTFTAIAAFVTSEARMRMNSLRAIAGQDNVYYQGVDALIVNKTGYDRLSEYGEIAENELGKLRLLLTTDQGEILGCADYRLGDKVVVAGRAKLYRHEETGQIMQRKFSATAELFNGTALPHVEEYNDTWQRHSKYFKGIVGSDGWVSPHCLETEALPT